MLYMSKYLYIVLHSAWMDGGSEAPQYFSSYPELLFITPGLNVRVSYAFLENIEREEK